jgi:hypothetical protein
VYLKKIFRGLRPRTPRGEGEDRKGREWRGRGHKGKEEKGGREGRERDWPPQCLTQIDAPGPLSYQDSGKRWGAQATPQIQQVMRGLCHAQTKTDQSYWCPSPWQSRAGAVAQPADSATGPRLTLSPTNWHLPGGQETTLFFGLSTRANRQPVLLTASAPKLWQNATRHQRETR